MEELLLNYLRKEMGWDNIKITRYNVDGAICTVKCEIGGDYEIININIWDMMVFLNSK